ncbi:MAG: TIGR01244 family sulfur transferase [Neisseria sp.]|nr:TIGR01244 family sulfur transferase [Neisseria sp.]
MSIYQLTENLYIAPQLSEADAEQAKQLGIKTVICNRPDGEEAGQASFEQVQNWLANTDAQTFHHQPVVASQISAADVAQFQQLLQNSDTPTLAYCRTGTRSSLLWAYHAVQNGISVEDAIAAAAKAQVNLSSFAERLQQAAQGDLA